MPRIPARLTALALVLLLAACGSDAPAPAAAPASLTVAVATPQTRTLPQRIAASGSVAAWEEISLGVELSGQRVDRVLVEVGDEVRAGQALLELDRRTLAVQLRQAEAALAQADANLQVAVANAARGRRLKAEQLIAAADADQLIAGELTARAQRQTALAQLESARLQLGFATLRAPDAGVVSARSVQPGQVVAPGAELLRMIRGGRLEWRAELPEDALVRVREGMAVRLRDPEGAAVDGIVRAVSPSLDARSRTGLVYADLPAPGALRAGMFAAGEIETGSAPALTIPDAALVERDGHRYLFVLGDDDTVRQRRVSTGARQDGLVQVLDGLAPEERVVVEGAGFLSDGDRVRVAPADATAAAADDAGTTDR